MNPKIYLRLLAEAETVLREILAGPRPPPQDRMNHYIIPQSRIRESCCLLFK